MPLYYTRKINFKGKLNNYLYKIFGDFKHPIQANLNYCERASKVVWIWTLDGQVLYYIRHWSQKIFTWIPCVSFPVLGFDLLG